MQPPLRIAVLECDAVLGRTMGKYWSYGPLYQGLLESGARYLAEQSDTPSAPPPALDVSKWDVVNTELYPDLDKIDAVIMTGSRYNSFDNDPWILKLVDFTREVLAQKRVRLIGVCFGHQIIGRALGVKVDRSERGWEVAVVPVTLTEKGKEVLGLQELAIHQMHRDIIYAYPDNVESLGSTEHCEVQGMYEKGRLISVQGHPEFTSDIITELLEKWHDTGAFDDTMYEEAMSRARKAHDGIAVGAAFIRFLLED